MSDWIPVIVAIVAALPGLVALLRQAKKDRVDGASAITQSAIALVKPLEDRINRLEVENKELCTLIEQEKEAKDALEKRVSLLEDEFERLLVGAHQLYNQVTNAGLPPVYKPPDRRRTERN